VAEFGCADCYGEDADAAWRHYTGGLTIDRYLVEDDSHFIVQLRRCRSCSQRFLWIFTEFVDWAGGRDAQYRRVVPVAPAEATTLAGRGADLDVPAIGALGEERRHLATDWPSTAGAQTVRWSTGRIPVVPGH
jgi:hypothetical protein